MKYFRDLDTGEVFAYEADGSQDAYIKAGLLRMTKEEVEAHLNPSQSAEQVRERLLTTNNNAYEAATAALTADYPKLEKDTWPTQDKESRAWVSDPENAVTPWIDRAAFERGIDREEYLRRTLAKAEQFKIMSSFLTGRRQRYEDAIKQGEEINLDYALTPEVIGELQQVANTIMVTTTGELKQVLQ